MMDPEQELLIQLRETPRHVFYELIRKISPEERALLYRRLGRLARSSGLPRESSGIGGIGVTNWFRSAFEEITAD